MVHLAALAAVTLTDPAPSPPLPSAQEVSVLAKGAMQRTGAKGLAVAIIDNGEVRSVQAFGIRNPRGEPLTTDTVMYGASLTKAAFAYFVMQLVDEGKIDLDKPIVDILPRPLASYGRYDDNGLGDFADIASDPRAATITPRMILTHSTGFANFSFLEPDRRLHIHFQPGTRYSYSGDGIIFLQLAIQEGLGLDVGAEMDRRFFDPLGLTNTGFSWKPGFAGNLADGWREDGTAIDHDHREHVRAAGSMDTSISDFAKFAAMMVRGDRLSAASAAERIRPQLVIDTVQQFPTLAPAAPPSERIAGLSAGLGVVTFVGPQGPGWFKGGHDDQTANTLVCIESSERCLLLLSNDVRAEAAFADLAKSILGDTGVPFQWEYHGLYGF